MRRIDEDYDWEYGDEWACSQQAKHILADPEHWSVYVVNFDLGDGNTYTGSYPADDLTPEQLRRILNLVEVSS